MTNTDDTFRRRRKTYEQLSTKSLIGIALQVWESDKSWYVIHELRNRAALETITIAKKLLSSKNWHKRTLALYIMCQLYQRRYNPNGGWKSEAYAVEEAEAMLIEAMSDSQDQVIAAAISGFSHRPTPKALPLIIPYANHPNSGIRFSLSVALGNYPEPESVAALLLLATDQKDGVRDWATFSLAGLTKNQNGFDYVDNPDIRERLWLNASTDTDLGVRGEALDGLANRKDPRAIELVKAELERGDCAVYALNAAETLANTRLYGILQDIWEKIQVELQDEEVDMNSYWLNSLKSAMDACEPNKQKIN